MKLALILIGLLSVVVFIQAEEAKKNEEKPVTSKNADELVAAALEAALSKLSPEHRKIVEETLKSTEEVKEEKVISAFLSVSGSDNVENIGGRREEG
ncbi:hypothetical protein PENTCL1PPCAC_8981 [Pristionchus entomophagus]|uniref:Uncharacterized protein n=1 Tax=Pristionchus entomophagus TaxID=358040 RepID=A0AAV5SUH7_9BILA|nr:hypothetical protein PENTCL1PPCAC_8981 [Pristionchus entomophagus]